MIGTIIRILVDINEKNKREEKRRLANKKEQNS